jgi:hypothetical protein
VTVDDFRKIALAQPDAEERAHMSHPDFRVRGKIFATLAYPNESYGMVKLTPEQQAAFVAEDPDAFVPVKGAWGAKGCTHVMLKKAKKPAVERAMASAWRTLAVTLPAKPQSGRSATRAPRGSKKP